MAPQFGALSFAVMPRKASAPIRPIEYAIRKLASTSSGAATLGSSSLRKMCNRDSPSASAAPMKSRSTTGVTAPRITRAILGVVVKATTTTISQFVRAKLEKTTSTRRSDGKAITMSIVRISTVSSAPLL